MTEVERKFKQDEPPDEQKGRRKSTGTVDPTHRATKPAGSGDRDEQAIEKAREGLDRAGGGH